jgi:flagellar basal body-associated protein FliL
MAVNNITSGADPHAKRRSLLRTLGVLVLLLGLGGAGAVYWTGAPPDDLSADPATARAYKTEARDIEINYGKMGVLMNELADDLNHPGTQAAIIAAVSVVVASGCFYFARWPEDDPVA